MTNHIIGGLPSWAPAAGTLIGVVAAATATIIKAVKYKVPSAKKARQNAADAGETVEDGERLPSLAEMWRENRRQALQIDSLRKQADQMLVYREAFDIVVPHLTLLMPALSLDEQNLLREVRRQRSPQHTDTGEIDLAGAR